MAKELEDYGKQLMLKKINDDSPIPDTAGAEALTESKNGCAKILGIKVSKVTYKQLKAYLYYGEDIKIIKEDLLK